MRRLLVLLPFLAACYSHVPVEPNAVRAGTSIRTRINAATAEELEPLLGIGNARLLTGVVITASPDTLIVEVPTSVRTGIGSSMQTLKQRVAIPRTSIFELETRRMDRLRTGLVVGSTSVLVGALIFRATVGGPGDERQPDGGEVNEFRFHLLRFRM